MIPIALKTEILNILDKSEHGRERSHAKNTLFWLKKLRPSASMALQIAALAHDIERCVLPRFMDKDFESHAEYKKAHSEKGAMILEEIMKHHDMKEKIIIETTNLVRLHEVGGNLDADILMDADSISFFDNNLDFYISYKGFAGAIKQVDYKFQRCSPRAQKYIVNLKMYKSFKKQIGQIKTDEP
ncbi:MAG: DUF4202 family protein [Oligoflexia bacterium]|nr:DUF4202 family protein [Oligoflexia bacterium]